MGILARISEKRADKQSYIQAFLAGDDWPGSMTSSGVYVSEESSLQISTVYKCVDLISKSLATVPLHIYKRTENGKEPAPFHKVQWLMNMRPNNYMTAIEYRKLLWAHYLLWGNHYALKGYNRINEVVSLTPLSPKGMQVFHVKDKIFYIYTAADGKKYEYTQEQIFHPKDLSIDGLVGLSKIRQQRDGLGLAKSTEAFGAKFFKNGIRPTGVFQHPAKLSDVAYKRLQESIKSQAGGDNQAGALIAEEGMTWQTTNIPPNEAQYIETREFSAVDICGIFNVPPHKIGILDNATYSNIEHQAIEFVVDTLLPQAVYLEQKIAIDLLTEDDREKYYAKHNLDGLLRGDTAARGEYYAKLFNIGAMSPNDIREKEDMNPYDGGEKYFVQLNMIPVEDADKMASMTRPMSDNSPDDNDDDDEKKSEMKEVEIRSVTNRSRVTKANRRIFEDAIRRIVNREDIAVKRAVDKYLRTGKTSDFRDWLKRYYEDMPPSVEKNMLGVFMTHADMIQYEANSEIGREPGMTPELEQFVRAYSDNYKYSYALSSQRQLEKILDETPDDLVADAIVARTTEWTQKRPEKEADRQTVEEGNAITKFVFIAGGITAIRWVAVGKSCPYCEALNGKIIGIENNFIGKNEELDPAGGNGPMKSYENKSHPPLHRGCDCTISSVSIL